MTIQSVRALLGVAALLCAAPQHAIGQTAPATTGEPAQALTVAGDPASGEKLYRRNCRACHGATAGGASSYPKLVGHPAEYLVDKIIRYRAGEAFGPNTPLMAQRVRNLSDQDVANVAAFIVSLEED